jgi:prepilin peptidase CpaA
MPSAAGVIDWLAVLVLLAALFSAALSDASSYIIPNRYPAAIAVAFLFFAIGKPLAFLLTGLAVGVGTLMFGAALFARGTLGGGDVKLLAATALWASLDRLPLLLFATAIGGGVLALAQLSPLHRLLPARPGASAATDFRGRMRQPVPFGIAIALGGVCIALSRVAS